MSNQVNTELYESVGQAISELGEDHMMSKIMRNNMACGDLEALQSNLSEAYDIITRFESQNDEYPEVY